MLIEKFHSMLLTDLTNWRDAARRQSISVEILEKLEEFDKHGFCVFPRSVPDRYCDQAITAYRQQFETEENREFKDANNHFPKLINSHVSVPQIGEIFSQNEEVLRFADVLFQQRTGLYTSIFFQRGSAQPLHVDAPYFTTVPESRYLGMWTALEDADEANGALMVYPGGHKVKGPSPEAIVREVFPGGRKLRKLEPDLWNRYQDRLMEECEKHGLKVTSLAMKKGDTLLWHPRLPHGGTPIKVPTRTRYSIVFHIVPEGTLTLQADKFFNPKRQVKIREKLVNWLIWRVRSINGRRIRYTPKPNFQVSKSGSQGKHEEQGQIPL